MTPADVRALIERAHCALADCPRGAQHDLADVVQALAAEAEAEARARVAAENRVRVLQRDLCRATRTVARQARRICAAVAMLRTFRRLLRVHGGEAEPIDLCLWGCEYPSRDTLIGGALRE